MRGLMMDRPLTIPMIVARAESLFRHVPIVSRRPDGTLYRYNYGEMFHRAKRFAAALIAAGIQPGDRVATFGWNQSQHLETYFAVTLIGAVLHTLNVRMHVDELAYIANQARDRVLVADYSLLETVEQLRARVPFERIVAMNAEGQLAEGVVDYEDVVGSAPVELFRVTESDERDAASMCYTSGTTGQPKGVVYSHRALVLQAIDWTVADSVGVRRSDVVLAVPPMFHINGWGLPFVAALAGAKIVLPGRDLDPENLLSLIAAEKVTLAAGVPTIWFNVLRALECGASDDISTLRTIASGGAAIPPALMRAWQERYGVTMLHLWGMTEMTAVGTVSRCPPELDGATLDEQLASRLKQGTPAQLVELRGRGDDGLIPWDGKTMGEIEVRGPMVASEYFDSAVSSDRFTRDGWLRTGDIGTIGPDGSLELKDRAKDVIKSGGEWISSVALENALIAHPAVADAAVIAVPHAKWGERPLGLIVVKNRHAVTSDELFAWLVSRFPKWYLPDDFAFVDALPRTATGKLQKASLRNQYRDVYVTSST